MSSSIGGSTWTVTGSLLDFYCTLICPCNYISHLDHSGYYDATRPAKVQGGGLVKVFSQRLGVDPGLFSTMFTVTRRHYPERVWVY